MALVRYGGGIVQMSGSIAGNTYARNRSGNYVRARTIPVNPNTQRQDVIRSAIAFLSDRWAATLTAPQRTAWNLYGDSVNMKNRLGETVKHSGYNHYIRSNAIRRQIGQALLDAGPVIFELPAQDPSFGLTAQEDTQLCYFTYDETMDWSTEDGSFLFLFEGKPQNAQRNFFKGPWRVTGAESGIDPGGQSGAISRPTLWGIAEGQHQWGYGRISRADGRLSEKFEADCFVAADGI